MSQGFSDGLADRAGIFAMRRRSVARILCGRTCPIIVDALSKVAKHSRIVASWKALDMPGYGPRWHQW